MSKFVVGLDLGTSSVRAGMFDMYGRKVALSSEGYDVYSPQAGWAEQNSREWWAGAKKALRKVMTGVDYSRIAGIGLCGQCPGNVLVNEQDEAIGNAIIWRDQRADKEAKWLVENISDSQMKTWTDTHLEYDPSAPPARLLWLRDHRPDDWERTCVVLQPKDYIGLKLTGEKGTDIKSAYSLVNPKSGKYEKEYFDFTGISIEKMPNVLPVTEVLGKVSKQAAEETGLPAGTPVITGTIDAWCESIAGGVTQKGRAVDVSGTSEIVSMHSEVDYAGGQVYLARLESENLQFLCGPTQGGGDALKWVSNVVFQEEHVQNLYDRLQSLASHAPAGSSGVIFLPYLYGERAPIWDPYAKAIFYGLSGSHSKEHLVRAVYEGIGFVVRHILEICEEINARKADYLVVCGGGSQNMFWNQLKADIVQCPVKTIQVRESACFGAAILASVGTAVFSNLKDACENMIQFVETIEPNKGNALVYEEGFQKYIMLYPALKEVYKVNR